VSVTQYYTAATLNGFIADEQHSLEWLFSCDQDRGGPLNYDQFFAEVGSLAMGASTYEWILEQEPAKWPYELPCWVFTHRRLDAVEAAPVTFTSADVARVHAELLEAARGRNVWIVGGGDLAGQFADAGLLDEVIVYIAPATVAGGAPLLPRRLDLRLEETARNRDFVTARFSVGRV
jgi:dihydrofolate reductase